MVQPGCRRDPDGAVPGREHGADVVDRQALRHGITRHRHVAESIDTATGADPDAPFTILEQRKHGIARQAVAVREDIRPAVVMVYEAEGVHARPQPAVAIHEQRIRDPIDRT
jgi:hypothetical protein